jgi:hypothetical protein
MAQEEGTRKASVVFALLSSCVSSAFIIFAIQYLLHLHKGLPLPPLWNLELCLFIWAGLFSVGLFLWGLQQIVGWRLIGHPTLEMVGGVSGTILAAVTFLLLLATEATH